MRQCLVLLLALVPGAASAAPNVVTSTKSGNWSDAATWAGGKAPVAGDAVLVRTGHTVTYDTESDAVIRAVHVSGTLTFAPDKATRLNVGLVKVQAGESTDENGFDCEAHVTPPKPGEPRPALLVGTPDAPVTRRAVVRLHYIDGMDKGSCPAIVCCGGRMEFHGAPMSRTWVKLGASARAGDTAVALAERVTGWNVGDRVLVTGTAKNSANDHAPGSYRAGASPAYAAHTEVRTVTAIDGTKLALDQPLQFAHRGADEYRAEVANLSRTVVVESAAPAGTRGHTMYHRYSGGGLGYAEFRHLGKEGALGRYAVHFHLCGDTMRGSVVQGCSIWDSHNRWVTVHGTQYLVVRDCVGYMSVGHGFFLEDGTEVYNTFARNLAVQAYRGTPLPRQALPFDKNDGAGFWWANSLNSFTGNVAVECDEYGFRYEATPKAGVTVGRQKYGDPAKPFDLRLSVRQPDGSAQPTDVRALPFVRFDDNEVHNQHNYGFNLGEGAAGVGPAADAPFVIRNLKVWQVRLGYRPNVPHVLIEGARFAANTYGIYQPEYVGHDYRGVTWSGLDGGGVRERRMPGNPKAGDGGGKVHPPEVEVVKLTPVDALPPHTVITHVTAKGGKLLVRGTCSDNGTVTGVSVNGVAAVPARANFAEWEVLLPAGPAKLTATATDATGNVEKTPHVVTVGR